MSVTAASLVVTLLSASLMMFTGQSSFSRSLQSPANGEVGGYKDIEIWDKDKNKVNLVEDPSSHLRSSILKHSDSQEDPGCRWSSCVSVMLPGNEVCERMGEGYFRIGYPYMDACASGYTQYRCCSFTPRSA